MLIFGLGRLLGCLVVVGYMEFDVSLMGLTSEFVLLVEAERSPFVSIDRHLTARLGRANGGL